MTNINKNAYTSKKDKTISSRRSQCFYKLQAFSNLFIKCYQRNKFPINAKKTLLLGTLYEDVCVAARIDSVGNAAEEDMD